MRRFMFWTLPVLTALLIVAPTALALVSGPPFADTYVDLQFPDDVLNGQDLRIQGSSGPGGGCDPVRIAFMKWDLTSLAGAPGYARLVLTTGLTAASSNSAGYQITLYQLADDDDGWTESISWNVGRPPLGPAIQTITLPVPGPIPQGTQIVFGDTDAGLLNYIQDEYDNRNKIASLAVRFTTCPATSIQWFEDRESGAQGPYLDLRTGPNSVTLRTFRSDNPAVSPVIWGGAGIALLAAVAGIIVARRRRLAN